VALLELTGKTVVRWLDVELPRVQNPRVDLLGEASDGELVHIELQSGNAPDMALRMSEYCLAIVRMFGKFPRQTLVYVGQEPMKMPAELRGPRQTLQWDTIDIRDLDGERLLESGDLSDNVIAILARLNDARDAVRRIVASCSELSGPQRAEALERLFVLGGLRRMEKIVEEEANRMPVYIDLGENKVLGPAYRKGLDEGRQEGLQEGRQQGELLVLRRLVTKRFGRLPVWAEERLAEMTAQQLEDLSERVLDAAKLADLFT